MRDSLSYPDNLLPEPNKLRKFSVLASRGAEFSQLATSAFSRCCNDFFIVTVAIRQIMTTKRTLL